MSAGAGAGAAPERAPPALDTWRASATHLLETELVPRLRKGAERRGDLPRFEVRADAGRDPRRVDAERRADGSVAVTVSAGFLLFADVLVDAEVLGRLAGRRGDVQPYFDEIVAFGGVSTRSEAEVATPTPFYVRLGWSKALYDVTFASAPYQDARSEVFVQAFTWAVAHAVVVAARGDGPDADRIAAEWLAQSGFAPLPNVGVAMLYFAAREPAERRPEAWRCRTRRVLENGVVAVESLQARGVALPREIPADLLARGRELARQAASDASCRRLQPTSAAVRL